MLGGCVSGGALVEMKVLVECLINLILMGNRKAILYSFVICIIFLSPLYKNSARQSLRACYILFGMHIEL